MIRQKRGLCRGQPGCGQLHVMVGGENALFRSIPDCDIGIVTKESSYPSSLISLHSQYSSPSLSLSSFSNRHPRQQKNNRTEQQQNNQTQSGSHETLSSTESPLLFRFYRSEFGGEIDRHQSNAERMEEFQKMCQNWYLFFIRFFCSDNSKT